MFALRVTEKCGYAGLAPGQRRALYRRRLILERLEVRCLLAADVFDFGDAPYPFPTQLTADGARHALTSDLRMGEHVDAESDGTADIWAEADDLNGVADDEDGVIFHGVPTPGADLTIEVRARGVTPGGTAYVDAWLDVNGDGDWYDPGEKILDSQPVPEGGRTFAVPLPAELSFGTTYTRFRLSSLGGLSPTGPASDGEVEDHRIVVLPQGNGVVLGQTFVDLDEDGERDADEPGMNGVSVVIGGGFAEGFLLKREISRDVDVDGDGQIDPFFERGLYRFEQLPPGEYSVWEEFETAIGPVEQGVFPYGGYYVFELLPGQEMGSWPAAGDTSCGPGSGWVGTCAAGLDEFTVTVTLLVDVADSAGGSLDGQTDLWMDLPGHIVVQRGQPSGSGPQRVLPLEIVDLELNGFGEVADSGEIDDDVVAVAVRAGDGVANLSSDGPLHSAGVLVAESPAATDAASTLSAFFRIDLPDQGLSLHNEEALEFFANVDRFPSWHTIHLATLAEAATLSLYDAQGQVRAQVLDAFLVAHRGLDFGNYVARWQNRLNRFDVSGNGRVEPEDAMLLIHYINVHSPSGGLPDTSSNPPPYLDVNGDGFCTASDVNAVIIELNGMPPAGAGGEGESFFAAIPPAGFPGAAGESHLAAPQTVAQPSPADQRPSALPGDDDAQRLAEATGMAIPAPSPPAQSTSEAAADWLESLLPDLLAQAFSGSAGGEAGD